MMERPFDNFRVAITDPLYFIGRNKLLESVKESPFQIRFLLGGRRLGKTSALRALEWRLLDIKSIQPCRAFPVFINLQLEQPDNFAHLLYIMIVRLREAIDRWYAVKWTELRKTYQQFLYRAASSQATISFLRSIISDINNEQRLIKDHFRSALLKSIEELRKGRFEGICFLLDEAEFVVHKEWANDAWSYFRGIKDSDVAIRPFIGIILSGYRDLKGYRQQIGSPLQNIGCIEWLKTLSDIETKQLIYRRIEQEEKQVSLTHEEISLIIQWAGCHPYLTQQMLNVIFDARLMEKSCHLESLLPEIVRKHASDFIGWWNLDGKSDGFSSIERILYSKLLNYPQGTAQTLAKITKQSVSKIDDALQVLVGTGVIHQLDEENYKLGSQIFKQWVTRDKDINCSSKRNKVFISYSHKDKVWLERLQAHIKPLEKEGIIKKGTISFWDDTKIKPGDLWRKEIQQALDSAKIAVLLVSADFLASDFITDHELPHLLSAAKDEGCTILSVNVKPSLFSYSILEQFQAVNSPSEPLSGLSEHEQDTLFVEVAKIIKETLG